MLKAEEFQTDSNNQAQKTIPNREANATIVFVGAPNSGKTSLYNQVTGSQHKTVNYPGATVDYSVGKSLEKFGETLKVIDTPGTYSLSCKSDDEKIAKRLLFKNLSVSNQRTVVCVVDATQLHRHLILSQQLKECGFQVVIALTMIDLLRKSGKEINAQKLSEKMGCPVLLTNGLTGEGVSKLVFALRALSSAASENEKASRIKAFKDWAPKNYEDFSTQASAITAEVISSTPSASSGEGSRSGSVSRSEQARTNRIDRFLLHPLFGALFFAGIMTLLFSSIFWMAAPFMDWVDGFFGGLAEQAESFFPESLFGNFLSNGIIASLGAVLVFVPQIFILFVGFGLLEDSGYLARAASLVDKPLSKAGLNGRSFVPILSGYACAIPGMMSARTIPSRREKLITLFILPLMSCSARLPVYGILLALLFWNQSAWIPGLVLTGIYLLSLLIGILVASIVSKFLPKKNSGFFMMELPYYRRPHFRSVFKMSLSKTMTYVRKAGPLIFIFAISLWALSTFPNYEMEDETERFSTSYASSVGRVLEPVMEPMGGDWRTGVSLLAAFAAREVFIPALAVIMSVGGDSEEEQEASLIANMQTVTRADGSLLFNAGSIAALIIFFMIALQCISTVGVAVQEFGGWLWPMTQLVAFNLLAYGLAVLIYQSYKFLN